MTPSRFPWLHFHSLAGRSWLVLTLIVALGLRLWVAWQPAPVLLEKNLPDDAYYYFMLARYTITSSSVSIDGLHLTNGFHPFWYVLILPIFGWPGPLDDFRVHLTLSLASLLDTVAVWAIAQLAARLTRQARLGSLAGLLYALNPMVILQATNGLETALGMACLTLFWLQLAVCLTAVPDRAAWLRLGILGGLMFLARSDSAFFLGFSLLSVIAALGWRVGLRRGLGVGSLAGLAIAPWFLWSRLAVGSWLQESGLAVPYAIHQRFALAGEPSALAVLNETVRQLTSSSLWLRGDAVSMPLIGGVLVWLLMLGLLLWRWRTAPQRRTEMIVMLPLLLAGFLLVAAHAGLRWYPRPWYFTPMAAFFAVAAALGVASLRVRATWLVGGLALWLVYNVATAALIWQIGLYPWQREMRAASEWIAATPEATRTASFNAGIYAYYSRRTVLNLDGVVNTSAYRAVRDREMIPYLQRSGVTWLVDYDHAIRREYAPFMGPGYPEALREVAVLGGQADGPLGLLRAYRVESSP
jgi:hypothetical protein